MEKPGETQEPAQYTRTDNLLYGCMAAAIFVMAAGFYLDDEKAGVLGFQAILAGIAIFWVRHTFGPKGNWLMRISLITVAAAQFLSLIGYPVV